MKKYFLLVTVVLLLSACAPSTDAIQTAIAKTRVAIAQTETARPTATSTQPPIATSTPLLTATLTPLPIATSTSLPTATSTPLPTPTPVTVAELEWALTQNGFTRSNITYTVQPNDVGNSWFKNNVFYTIEVYSDGKVKLDVLSDKSPDIRSQHMEPFLRVLDQVFPAEFMAELRKANDAYNQSSTGTISGDPAQSRVFNDAFSTVAAQFNVSQTTIGAYPVAFSLWFWQGTCPSYAYYCYYPNFPGQEFTGDSSLTFYDIQINIAP